MKFKNPPKTNVDSRPSALTSLTDYLRSNEASGLQAGEMAQPLGARLTTKSV